MAKLRCPEADSIILLVFGMVCSFDFAVQGTESRALHIPGRHTDLTTEPHSPCSVHFDLENLQLMMGSSRHRPAQAKEPWGLF